MGMFRSLVGEIIGRMGMCIILLEEVVRVEEIIMGV